MKFIKAFWNMKSIPYDDAHLFMLLCCTTMLFYDLQRCQRRDRHIRFAVLFVNSSTIHSYKRCKDTNLLNAFSNFRRAFSSFRRAFSKFRHAFPNFRRAFSNFRRAFPNFRRAFSKFRRAFPKFRRAFSNFRRTLSF